MSGASRQTPPIQSPFCVSFLSIVSCQLVVGGALNASATNAEQTNFFDVARIRAEPLHPPQGNTVELTAVQTAGPVPKVTV
jgi:hypothetical protein